jgi:Ferritin-like domain
MASNDVEVLDPAAPVEKNTTSGFELDRRHFIAALGVAGAAAGAALISSSRALAQQPIPNGYAQVDVINLMLQVKYLKATLYSFITQGTDLPGASQVTVGTGQVFLAPAKITFAAAGLSSAQQITDLFNEMYYDELNQLIALRALQGVSVAPRQTINLIGTGPSGGSTLPAATTTLTPLQAIGLARLLEDLSTSAFTTATTYLTGRNLALATQCLASDGAHAGAIRLLAIQTGAPYQSSQFASITSSNSAQAPITFAGSTAAASNLIYETLPTWATGTTYTTGQVVVFQGNGKGYVSLSNGNAGNQPDISTSSWAVLTAGVTPPVTPAGLPQVGNILTGNGLPPGAGAIVTAVSTPGNAYLNAITNKNNTLTFLSSVAGLGILPGMPVTSGTFISANTVVTAVGTNTITLNNTTPTASTVAPNGFITNLSPTITGVSSVTGLIVGQPITGTGIPTSPATTINAIGTNTITLSAPATVTVNLSLTGALTTGSTTIQNLSTINGLVIGQPITGAGIPTSPPTTITGVNATSLTMSAAATATSPGSTLLPFSGIVTNASANITLVSSFSGLAVGQVVGGPGIIAGTTIKTLTPATNTIVMSANANATSTVAITAANVTLGSNIVSGLGSVAGIVNLQTITGTGIPANTTITSIGTNTLTISNNATLTNVGAAYASSAPENIFVGGQLLTTPTTAVVTSPTTLAIVIGLTQITIAGTATATGTNNISVVVPDAQDVEPGDPGTATLSASGPTAIAGTSPAVYQGFFNTAGSATSSTTTPPGFAFARSFQQILAVLYGYNSTNSLIVTQNFEGGFYPFGVSGTITSAI